jgi:uncharacterized membrane protein YfcA
MTLAPIVSVAGVMVLAGLAQGLTGFGFGLIAMGLLPLVIGLDEAQAVATLTGVVACVAMTGVAIKHVQWSSTRHLWISTIVGVPLGYFVLTMLSPVVVIRLLGLAICLLVCFEIFVTRRYAVRLPDWSGWFMGLASGALSGAFNIGGPPLVAYIYDRPWSKEQQVATLSSVFVASGLVRSAILIGHGKIHESTCISTAWSIVPMLAAIVCGNRLLKYIPQNHLRSGIYAVLFLLGARYLIVGQ